MQPTQFLEKNKIMWFNLLPLADMKNNFYLYTIYGTVHTKRRIRSQTKRCHAILIRTCLFQAICECGIACGLFHNMHLHTDDFPIMVV